MRQRAHCAQVQTNLQTAASILGTPDEVVMKKDVAIHVSNLMLEYGKKLDDSVALVMQHGTEAEALQYRKAIGKIMGEMLLEIMNPIYEQHPDLKPDELD
jgi:hypothetical protein